jgi:hypothetical protein
MTKNFYEGNQIHNFMSSSGFGTVINYGSGSGSDFLTSYGSGYGSGPTSQKVTVPTVPVPVPVPQHCTWVAGHSKKLLEELRNEKFNSVHSVRGTANEITENVSAFFANLKQLGINRLLHDML